jgi:hypothetical protein
VTERDEAISDPMIEIRWVKIGAGRQLEYRSLVPCVNASGCLCAPSIWSRWRIVQTIQANDAAYEDVRASGGIMEAP